MGVITIPEFKKGPQVTTALADFLYTLRCLVISKDKTDRKTCLLHKLFAEWWLRIHIRWPKDIIPNGREHYTIYRDPARANFDKCLRIMNSLRAWHCNNKWRYHPLKTRVKWICLTILTNSNTFLLKRRSRMINGFNSTRRVLDSGLNIYYFKTNFTEWPNYI